MVGLPTFSTATAAGPKVGNFPSLVTRGIPSVLRGSQINDLGKTPVKILLY